CMPVKSEKWSGGVYNFLPKSELLTFEEIIRFTKILVKLGIEKVRITGGEPLVKENIEGLISKLSKIKGIKDLALTTNGFNLTDYASELKKAGLNRITVSLNSLNNEVFKKVNNCECNVENILDGIKTAENAGFVSIKINTVIQRGVNDKDILDIAEYFKGTSHIPRFIEYMDVGNLNDWDPEDVVPGADIIKTINKRYPLEPVLSSNNGEVAKKFRYTDGSGEIGIITSISQPFCSDCTRLRLSTDGKLYTCLFSSDHIDLKKEIRGGVSDKKINDILQSLWFNRDDRYSELRNTHLRNENPTQKNKKVEMHRIGG
ncbi:GTP 3',8-cyclase MoaA, partial [candidate division KSB1 bacterium]